MNVNIFLKRLSLNLRDILFLIYVAGLAIYLFLALAQVIFSLIKNLSFI